MLYCVVDEQMSRWNITFIGMGLVKNPCVLKLVQFFAKLGSAVGNIVNKVNFTFALISKKKEFFEILVSEYSKNFRNFMFLRTMKTCFPLFFVKTADFEDFGSPPYILASLKFTSHCSIRRSLCIAQFSTPPLPPWLSPFPTTVCVTLSP